MSREFDHRFGEAIVVSVDVPGSPNSVRIRMFDSAEADVPRPCVHGNVEIGTWLQTFDSGFSWYAEAEK